MKKITFLKILWLVVGIFGLALNITFLQAQHLFSVSYNDVSKENVTLLKNQMTRSEIATLSLTKNNENKDVYSVALSSAQNTKIVILNERTGNNVTITPADESFTEFQLAPFFIEELRQGVLGNANRYAILETTNDFSVKSVASVSATKEGVFVPQYFYGSKENVKEALPKERQIVDIFKQTPRLILANSDDPELLRYAAQWEEERSYYIYIFKLPNGTLCTYDEHFDPDNSKSAIRIGESLQFDLTAINMNEARITASEYAFGLWGEQLSGPIPVDISIESKNLGNGVIGQSWRTQNFLNTGEVPGVPVNTWYPSPLWNQLVGFDATAQRDIVLDMNSSMNFYLQPTGTVQGIDWITVMLHEVCHGLGFYPIVGQNGAYSYGAHPGIFDRQLFSGLTGPCITELTQSERAALVVSDNLFAGAPGSNLLNANGGNRVKMYAPTTWAGGSSTSHWQPSGQPFSTFMGPWINNNWRLHTFNTRKIGVLLDLGWTEPIINPNASWVTFMANGGTGSMTNQQFLPGVAQDLRRNDFTKTGHTFTGWNTQADGTGTSYENQQSITLPGNTDITLYAQWVANTYTLTFNPGNDGTVNPTSKQVTFGEPIGEMPIPVRTGYNFTNWRYATTVWTEETIWDYPQNMTATAGWQAVTYTITATATPGGAISPSGNVTVNYGSNRTFAIIPDTDYEILDVLVDDESVGNGNTYTFSNIKAAHTIHAVFKETVGIVETLRATSLQIVPNPADHTIELRIGTAGLLNSIQYSNDGVSQIEFYNIFGQLIKSVPFTGQSSKEGVSTQTINISDLYAGVYMVKVGNKTVKLIVHN